MSKTKNKNKIRNYVENYTFHRNLTRPEWNKLRGRFSKREFREKSKIDLEAGILVDPRGKTLKIALTIEPILQP